MLICVTGMPGAGKSEVARRLAKHLNAKLLNMGDFVRAEALKRGLPVNRDNLMRLASELREELGPDVIARLVLASISEDSLYVIDGVRNLEEINTFRSKTQVILVAVHASPKERFRRLLSRGRKDDPKNYQEFLERDLKELKLGLGNAIAMADLIIMNQGKDIELVVREALKMIEEAMKDVRTNCNL
ncbi:MAG: AAA family ATPase [Desulfurococcaceae archaeon TW002]